MMKTKVWKKLTGKLGKMLLMAGAICAFAVSPALAVDVQPISAKPLTITLQTAMEKVLANSGDVIGATNDLEKAKIQLVQAQKQAKELHKALGKPDESQMTQDVYGAIVFGPAAKEIAVRMSEQGAAASIAGAKINTITLYYTIASCGKAENAAVDALNKAKTQYNVVNSKFKVGMAAKLEVLSAQIQLDNAKIALESARNSTAQNKRSLCALMGMPVNTQFSLGSTLTYTKLNLGDTNKAVADLVLKSPTVALDKLNYELAELQYNYDIGYLASFTYNGQIAQKTFDSAKAKYETSKRNAEAAANKQIEGLMLAEKQYNMAVSTKDLNAEVYRLAVLKYNNGLATQNDVLAAASDLSAVNSQVIGALLQFNIAKTALEQGLITQ